MGSTARFKSAVIASAGLLVVSLIGAPLAHAALGNILKDNDPGGPQGNGRGVAFDGVNLYYTVAGNNAIYRMSTAGGPPSALGLLVVPPGDPRVSFGGPLTMDATGAIWTIDQTSALVLYKVDAFTGATTFSCSIPAANPGHPALSALANPDGLDWDGSHLILSGVRSRPQSPANAIAFINPSNCLITSWFTPPIGQGAAGFGTSGVAFDNKYLWHATPDNTGAGAAIFQTDTNGVPTGLKFPAPRQTVDLTYDPTTFAPTCVLWGHEGSEKDFTPPTLRKQHLTAYEVPCQSTNKAPTCAAGGPYTAECNAGTGTFHLSALGSIDPDGDTMSYAWVTNCAGASLTNPNGATTDLIANGPPACPVTCNVALTIDDGHSHTVSCSTPLAIADVTPPTLQVPSPLTLECAGPSGVLTSDPQVQNFLGKGTASDSCTLAAVSNDLLSGYLPFACGGSTTAVNFTGRDDCGNATVAASSIIVGDTTPPVLHAPAPITLECTGPNGVSGSDPAIAALLGLANSSDACGSASLSNNAPGNFPVACGGQVTPITFQSTDNCGNISILTSSVTVSDTTGPNLQIPPRLRIQCDSPNPIPASDPRIQNWLAQASTNDLCGTSTLSNNAVDFPTMCKGPQGVEVFFTGTDACGNTAQGIGDVKVIDEVEPNVVCPAPLITTCQKDVPPGSDPLIASWLGTVAVRDACGAATTSYIRPTAFDHKCRPGTSIPVKFAGTDACGNVQTCTVNITLNGKKRGKK